MAKQVQWRRGTTAQNDAFTGAEGEITIDMGENYGITEDADGNTVINPFTLRVHDDKTPGGWRLVNEDMLSRTINETMMNLNNPDPETTPFLLHSGGNYMTGTLRSKMGAYLADGNQTNNTTAINIMYPTNEYRDILFSTTSVETTTDPETGVSTVTEVEGGANNSVIRSVSQKVGGVVYNSLYLGNYTSSVKTGLPPSYLHIRTNATTGETEFIIKPDGYLSPESQLYRDLLGNTTGTTLNYVATTNFVKNYTDSAITSLSSSIEKYTLPTASASTLGGVKIGRGIGISDGVISVSGLTSSSTGDTKLLYWTGSTFKNSTKSVGGPKKPIYLASGTFTAFSDTIGATGKPVYFNEGVITECNVDSIVSGHSGTIASSSKLGHIKVGSGLSISSDGTLSTTAISAETLIGSSVGSATNPVYVTGGKLTASQANVCNNGTTLMTLTGGVLTKSTATVGNATTPVYLNNGTLTTCGTVGLPIGSIVFFAMGCNPTSGWLKCAGGEYSKTTYKALADKIGTSYGTASDSEKFKVPDLRKKVPWMGDTFTNGYVESGLPNIKGHFQFKNFGHAYANVGTDGAFWVESSGIRGSDGKHGGFRVNFDASKSNTIYGGANIVRPPGTAGNWFIKYA